MPGRVNASAIAPAPAGSVSPRLTQGFTQDGGINRASGPGLVDSRARKRAGTGFHAAQTRRRPAKERENLTSSQPPARRDRPVGRNAMKLKHTPGQVDADGGNVSHGWLLCSGTFRRPNFFGAARRREQELSTPSLAAIMADLAAGLDLATRKIVGWSMRDHMRAELPLAVPVMGRR